MFYHILHILWKSIGHPSSQKFMTGWRYYHTSNAMHDTNTVQEKGTSVMCDSDTFLYMVIFFFGLCEFH